MTIDITERGADSSGSEPIDDASSDAMEDGVTVEFPPGTYRVEKIMTCAWPGRMQRSWSK